MTAIILIFVTEFRDCCGVMVDHTRSVFCGLSSVLQSLVNSSGDIAMYRFRR